MRSEASTAKPLILAHAEKRRPPASGSALLGIGIAVTLALGVVAAFGTTPETVSTEIPRTAIVERLAIEPAVAQGPTTNAIYTHEERIARGDTLISILARLGVDDSAASAFLRGDSTAQSMARQLSPGKSVTAWTSQEGSLHRLTFPLNGEGDKVLIVERSNQGFSAKEQSLKLETRVVMKSAEIRYSLFGASDAAEIPDSVAIQLADIFGGDIDFHRDLRKGDRFAVVYESIVHLGREIRSGRLLAAEFINDGKPYRAAWFPGDAASGGGYYTEEGKSIRKTFLRSPLEFSRVTSGFSRSRFHPLLKELRAHKGIDYGAPVGTRVKATGAGMVEFAGRQGGYGNVVVLRHQRAYTTLYGHLSKIQTGLRRGSRVHQGDVIGYVGATGLASGPHLHYEFRIGGAHQNPLAIILPSAPPLRPTQLPGFKAQTTPHFARIELIRDATTLALVN